MKPDVHYTSGALRVRIRKLFPPLVRMVADF
jgi:hypothetical protein